MNILGKNFKSLNFSGDIFSQRKQRLVFEKFMKEKKSMKSLL